MELSIKEGEIESKTKDSEGFKHINEYKILKLVGEGATGKVCSCINTKTQEKFAIKVFNKFILWKQKEYVKNKKSGKGMIIKTGVDKILKEIDLFWHLKHENVLTLHEIINDDEHDKLYLSKIPLFSSWSMWKRRSDDMACRFKGIQALHWRIIFHRILDQITFDWFY